MTEEQREALGKMLNRIGVVQAHLRAQIKPTLAALSELQSMVDEALEEAGLTDEPETCEGCERMLIAGDLVHTFTDGPVLCEGCAPTYGDVLKEYQAAPESDLQTWLDDERTKEEILASVAAHDPAQKAVHPL